MLAAVLLLMSAALTGLRCIDAAHTAARMSAIGEPSDAVQNVAQKLVGPQATTALNRSEEHTSELQSRGHLVCRLLLEKKKTDESPPSNWNPNPSRRAIST